MTGLAFAPLGEPDLDAVLAAEAELHACPWSRANFTDSLASDYWCWVARAGEDLAGYAVVMPVVDEAHLLDITILRAWQGRGLGGEFLDFLLQKAREAGMGSMLLEVRPSNEPARALYTRRGFRRIGLRKGYYPAPQGREDALVMVLEL